MKIYARLRGFQVRRSETLLEGALENVSLLTSLRIQFPIGSGNHSHEILQHFFSPSVCFKTFMWMDNSRRKQIYFVLSLREQ